jgi:hypothetical protein
VADLFITDEDVRGVIAKDDEIVSSIHAAFESLTKDQQAKGASQLAAWMADTKAYDDWAHAAIEALTSIWHPALGIPGTQYKYHTFGATLYGEGIAFGDRLLLHAKDVQALGGALGALPVLPPPPSPLEFPKIPKLELPSLGDDTKLLIGAGLLLGLILALKK